MDFLKTLLAQASEAALTAVDMTVAVKGGGGQAQRVLPEGHCDARLIQVIEYGMQPQSMKGVPCDPAHDTQLVFALYGPGISEGEGVEPDQQGKPYIMRLFPFKISQNEKANSFMLFKALNWKGTATCFAQLIGESYLAKIITHKPDAAGVAKGYKESSRIDNKGFLPPIDPRSKKPYDIAMPDESYFKLFLWAKPTKAAWDSMHIEGTNEDGSSKNFVQNKILGALDFAGSALEQMLMATGTAYTVPAAKAAPVKPAGPQSSAMAMPDLGADMMDPEIPAVHNSGTAPIDPPFDQPHSPISPEQTAALRPTPEPEMPELP